MSIKWMTQVWRSSAPAHPTERLLLLALADNANDEGFCWPSVETLRAKCRLRTLRGTRKVLERLEMRGFVRRIARPGRSNVYELLEAALATPVPEDRGQAEETPERADRGGEVRQDRGPGTPGPGTPEPGDRGGRSARTGRTIIEPSIRTINNNSGPAAVEPPDDTNAGVVVDLHSDLERMLEERGVHRAVALELVRRFGAGAVRAQIEHYDQVSARDGPAPGPGWLVKAIRESYALPPQRTRCETRFTYQQMLAWCEARGDLHLTQLFTPVKEEGKTFFELRDGRGGPDPPQESRSAR